MGYRMATLVSQIASFRDPAGREIEDAALVLERPHAGFPGHPYEQAPEMLVEAGRLTRPKLRLPRDSV